MRAFFWCVCMSLSRVIGLLVAILCIAGLFAPNHYFPWGAYYNEMPVGLALVPIVAWCLFFGTETHCSLPRHLFMLMALPLIPILQWQFDLIHFSGDAWVASLYLSGAVLACYAGFLLANSQQCGARALVDWFSWVLLFGALLSTFLALRQVFGLNGSLWEIQIPPGGRPGANLAQPNQLATLLLLGFVSLSHLRGIRWIGDIGFAIAALALGLGLATVQSRSALLVELALAGWLLWKFPQSIERKRTLILALSALSIFMLIWFCWPYLYSLWLSDGSVAVTRSVHDVARIVILRQMFDAMTLSPLFGYGWGQVSFAQMAVAGSYPSGVITESAHNFFVDLLIWNGVPLGALLVLSIVVWGVRRIAKEQSIASWYALGVIGTILVHAMLEYPLHYAYFLLPVAAMVGVADAELGAKVVRVPKLIVGSLTVYCFALFLSVLVEYPAVEEGTRKLRFQSIGAARKGGDEILDEAQKLRVLSQMKGFFEFALEPARDGMSKDELERMRVASRRFPFAGSISRYALALALNGYPADVAREMQILRSLHGENAYAKAKNDLMQLRNRYPQLANLNL